MREWDDEELEKIDGDITDLMLSMCQECRFMAAMRVIESVSTDLVKELQICIEDRLPNEPPSIEPVPEPEHVRGGCYDPLHNAHHIVQQTVMSDEAAIKIVENSVESMCEKCRMRAVDIIVSEASTDELDAIIQKANDLMPFDDCYERVKRPIGSLLLPGEVDENH